MSLEKICNLKPEESELLFSSSASEGLIEVRQWQTYRWLHIGDKSIQALMITNAVEQVVLPNIRALLATLLFCPKPKHVLNIGLGGASLERYLAAKWPAVKLTSVESNRRVIELAKQYFYLPKTVDIKHDLADKFVQKNTQRYDVVLGDIFVADNPASCLYEERFYADILDGIRTDGILALNILPKSEDDLVNILRLLKNHFSYIYLLEFPDFDNVIVFSSCIKVPGDKELNKRAEKLYVETQLDLRDIPDRLNTLLETV